MLVAIAYHYIRDSFASPHPSILGLTPEELSTQLDRLGRIAPFVSQADLSDAVDGRRALPRHCWLLTFDDGLREQYELAWPVLQRQGVPAIFFINTETVFDGVPATAHKIHVLRSRIASSAILAVVRELISAFGFQTTIDGQNPYRFDDAAGAELKYLLNFALSHADASVIVDAACARLLGAEADDLCADLYMTPSQVSPLADAGCIGTHSHSHVALARLPADTASAQIRRSCELLELHTGTPPVSISYPYGSIDACSIAVADLAASAGLKFGFTTEPAANVSLDAPMLLARIDCNEAPGGRHAPVHTDGFFERLPQATYYRRGD